MSKNNHVTYTTINGPSLGNYGLNAVAALPVAPIPTALPNVASVASLPQTPNDLIDKDTIEDMLGQAVSTTLFKARDTSKRMIDAMLEQVKQELAGYTKPEPKVMAVSVNGEAAKPLSKPAPQYLAHMIINAKLGINTLLVGPKGCGKTTSAELLSEALGLPFAFLNGSMGISETAFYGRQNAHSFTNTPFLECYRNGGVFLADEIDAFDASCLLAINTAIAGKRLSNPISGETIARHPNFVLVAGANTHGKGSDSAYTGRVRLDAATLDRFVTIDVDYMSEADKQACPDDALRQLLLNARQRLRDLRSDETISTRKLNQVYLQVIGGIAVNDAIKSALGGFPEELVMSIGLDAQTVTKALKHASTKSNPKTKAATKEEEQSTPNDAPKPPASDTSELPSI